MGRNSTGAVTTNQCLQININFFAKHIRKNNLPCHNTISWNTGATIGFIISEERDGLFLTLNYTKTFEEKKQDFAYKIFIKPLPSNLGKGFNYYFICPISGLRCKIIYMAYGSDYFKCRQAYKNRIYYPSQISSRLNFHNDKYWSLENTLKTLYLKHPKTHYKQKNIQAQQRIKMLEAKLDFHDQMRWRILPKALMKSFFI